MFAFVSVNKIESVTISRLLLSQLFHRILDNTNQRPDCKTFNLIFDLQCPQKAASFFYSFQKITIVNTVGHFCPWSYFYIQVEIKSKKQCKIYTNKSLKSNGRPRSFTGNCKKSTPLFYRKAFNGKVVDKALWLISHDSDCVFRENLAS